MTKPRTPRPRRKPLPLWRHLRADVAAAVALTCLPALAGLAEEGPADTIAAQIRTQGYACSAPVAATRDRAASRPNETVWLLQCGNARYRVQLVPDMAAQVTRLD
jgi:hypothetical protein